LSLTLGKIARVCKLLGELEFSRGLREKYENNPAPIRQHLCQNGEANSSPHGKRIFFASIE
jgi:hypothetical protein